MFKSVLLFLSPIELQLKSQCTDNLIRVRPLKRTVFERSKALMIDPGGRWREDPFDPFVGVLQYFINPKNMIN